MAACTLRGMRSSVNARCVTPFAKIGAMGDDVASRLRWARQQHGKYATPTEAARAFGWPVSTYLGHENGDRVPTRANAKKYSARYGVRWEWLLENEGNPTGKAVHAPLAGNLSASGAIDFYPSDQKTDNVELPPGGTARTVAIEVLGGSMRGIADDHWLIYFDHEQRPPTADLLGKLCVVEISDGSVLVRTLAPGRRKGRYDLESPTLPTMRDCRVRWAARVTWIKPR